MTPLAVSYAMPAAEALAALVERHYPLPGPVQCALINRGYNDCYLATAADGQRFVLRISGNRARGPADVAGETEFLAFLDAAGVPVATAVPTRDGALFTTAPLPQGPRAVVLFRHVEGRRPELDEPDDARLQGFTLAQLHDAATRFPGRESGRYRLDLDHLLHREVASVLALGLSATAGLTAVAHRLADRVAAVESGLTKVRCHGDCHGLNARIATPRPHAGPHAGRAVFFDFDDGGFGYLAYDLAVHLWAQVSFGRRRHPMWHAFMAGYRSVRPISPADEAAIPLFVPIRHIWLMGQVSSRTAEWGTEFLTPAWLEGETQFLLAWERDQLSRRLL